VMSRLLAFLRRRWRVLALLVSSAVGALLTVSPSWALSSCTTTTSSSGSSSTTCSVTIPGIASPLGGASKTLGSGVVNWVTGTGIPIFLGLIALAVVLSLVVRLVRRGARSIG
jgi:hypothetical protein